MAHGKTAEPGAPTIRFGAGVLIAITIAAVIGAVAGQAEAAKRPNIVLIMSDDMGYSDIGCYGGEIDTPNLDRLAEGGLRFTQFYNTGRCCPTRASLLTGLYPHQAGVGHMMRDQGLPGYQGDLNDRCRTIAEVLGRAGYATYISGKWHVTPYPSQSKANWPLQRGFDRFFGTIHGAGSFYDPNGLARGNTFIPPHEAGPEFTNDNFYYTDAISANAGRYIREHQDRSPDKPFFLYVSYTAPHWPMQAPPEDIAEYEGVYDEGWDTIREARYERMRRMGLIREEWGLSPRDPVVAPWSESENREWNRRCMEVYAAMVDRMDRGIGRIVEALERTENLEDTLVLYLHDNGACAERLGRRGDFTPRPKEPVEPMGRDELQTKMIPEFTREGYPVRQGQGVMPGSADTYIAYGRGWANASNTPFREYKHWVHEGGIATPLIAHWPEGIDRAGEFVRQPGHLVDIMATCVELGEADYPQRVDGREIRPLQGVSLTPAFEGNKLSREEPIFFEHEGNRALRDGRWKLVAKGAGSGWELYDMEAERSELNDLAEERPELTMQMAEQWERMAERFNVLPWPWNPQYGGEPGEIGSDASRFELSPNDVLTRVVAPAVEGKAVKVTAHIVRPGDGVLVAQGGSADGYALYVEDGRPHFAVRRGGALTVAAAERSLPENGATVTATLEKDGRVTLRLDGDPVARDKAQGAMRRMPVDGLEVGRDAGGQVGTYGEAFPFEGTIERIIIELGE